MYHSSCYNIFKNHYNSVPDSSYNQSHCLLFCSYNISILFYVYFLGHLHIIRQNRIGKCLKLIRQVTYIEAVRKFILLCTFAGKSFLIQQSAQLKRSLVSRIRQSHLLSHDLSDRRSKQWIMRTSQDKCIYLFILQLLQISGSNLICHRIM